METWPKKSPKSSDFPPKIKTMWHNINFFIFIFHIFSKFQTNKNGWNEGVANENIAIEHGEQENVATNE